MSIQSLKGGEPKVSSDRSVQPPQHSASKTSRTFHHGTTIGPRGKFKEANVGLVFMTTSEFFVVPPELDRIADGFARGSSGTPVVLTVCPLDPNAVLSPANIHGHVCFPADTLLRIESIRLVTGQPTVRQGDFSCHSSLNGWL